MWQWKLESIGLKVLALAVWNSLTVLVLAGKLTSCKASSVATQIACIVAWNAFLFLTTPIFMRPWFLFNYHKELRVLVPGPIHYFVKRSLQ